MNKPLIKTLRLFVFLSAFAPLWQKKIATKTLRHQDSPGVYLSMTYFWCNFVPWSLGGKNELSGVDSIFNFEFSFHILH